MTEQTMAHKVAALFDNDGQRFTIESGACHIDNLLVFLGTTVTSSTGFADDPIRYEFCDGSAIVICGDGWDVEGVDLYSWEGA